MPSAEPLAAATREALLHTSTASISTELVLRGLPNTFMTGVAPLRPGVRMVGEAFTLRYLPARADMDERRIDFDNRTNVQRLAVEAVGPGQVLVIDARRDLEAASLGHILATRIQARGAAGIVTDGALRDSPAIAELDMPTFSGGPHALISTLRHHPIDMGLPIACGGVLVVPGDIVVGDGEGVIVIPRSHVDEVARAALRREQLEAFITEKIATGASIVGIYPPTQDVMDEFEAAEAQAPRSINDQDWT
jgi:regulator of RNase E activity RraA